MAVPIKSVSEAAAALSRASAFLQDVESALAVAKRSSHTARALTKRELDLFVRNGNSGELRLVCDDEKEAEEVLQRIRDCEFVGSSNVLVVVKTDANWSLVDTSFEDCIIETGASVKRTTLVRKCILRSNSLVLGCGIVTGPTGGKKTTFANGLSVSPGLETGGRSVNVVADSTLEQLARVSLDQFKEKDAKKQYDAAVSSYCSTCTSEYTIVMPSAKVIASPEISASFIGRYAEVTSGARVANSTLQDYSSVETGSDVINSILQQKSHVSTQAIIKDSLICQAGSVDVQGKLLGSILGPGSHLAEGEITSSLIGPMVGFHHQSMLIATFWPSGRGNVGYGANCGSNHTSRVSDQTMWPGESVFFGLGCCVKFPLNLSEAPYTVIATGVVYGPGRLAFPFSLVTSDAKGCRVAPGWGFASNAYALERNSTKMKSRAPAGYAHEILRPEIVALVLNARNVLIEALKRHPKSATLWDDPDNGFHLAGGYCTRDDAEKAIRSYTKLAELYALRGAMQYGLVASGQEMPVALEHDVASTGLLIEHEAVHQRHVQRILATMLPSNVALAELAVKAEFDYAKAVYESKARDHIRGRHVFPTGRYDEAISLEGDPVITGARKRAEQLAKRGKGNL